MYNDSYIDPVFAGYLNRYCTGIVLFKDALQKVSVFHNLSDSFSNHACRFYIRVEFIDSREFSTEEEWVLNQYFYDNYNTSGNEFVSFVYKGQGENEIDENEIKSFIYHYQFAQELFKGFIKNILPKSCSLGIESLDTEPFSII